jgi:ABC-2 type transport system ATP-binding protein
VATSPDLIREIHLELLQTFGKCIGCGFHPRPALDSPAEDLITVIGRFDRRASERDFGYEGELAELRDRAGVSYRLRTAAEERAREVCSVQRGIEDVREAPGGGLLFRATDQAAVGELSLALAESGAAVLELAPQQASLEDLFFQLTEGDDGAEGAARIASAAAELP